MKLNKQHLQYLRYVASGTGPSCAATQSVLDLIDDLQDRIRQAVDILNDGFKAPELMRALVLEVLTEQS